MATAYEEFPFYRLRNGNSKVPENSVMGEYFLTKVTTNCHKDEIVFAGDCFHTFWEDQNRMEFLNTVSHIKTRHLVYFGRIHTK